MLHTHAQSHLKEIDIAAAAFPHPRPSDDGTEATRIGVHRVLPLALRTHRGLDLVTVDVEVAQIAAAALFQFTPSDFARPPQPAGEREHAERTDAHQWEEPSGQASHARH